MYRIAIMDMIKYKIYYYVSFTGTYGQFFKGDVRVTSEMPYRVFVNQDDAEKVKEHVRDVIVSNDPAYDMLDFIAVQPVWLGGL